MTWGFTVNKNVCRPFLYHTLAIQTHTPATLITSLVQLWQSSICDAQFAFNIAQGEFQMKDTRGSRTNQQNNCTASTRKKTIFLFLLNSFVINHVKIQHLEKQIIDQKKVQFLFRSNSSPQLTGTSITIYFEFNTYSNLL